MTDIQLMHHCEACKKNRSQLAANEQKIPTKEPSGQASAGSVTAIPLLTYETIRMPFHMLRSLCARAGSKNGR